MPGERDERDEIKEIIELLEHSVTNSPSSTEHNDADEPGSITAAAPSDHGIESKESRGDSGIVPDKESTAQSASRGFITPKKLWTDQSIAPAASKKAGAGRSGLPAVKQKSGIARPGGSSISVKTDLVPAEEQRGLTEVAANDDHSVPENDNQIIAYDIPPNRKPGKRAAPEFDTGSEKFKVKFDFEAAYRDIPEDRPIRLRREKRTGCIGGILYAAFVICVSLVLACLVWMGAVDVLGFGAKDEQVNVAVSQGFAIEDITEMLYDAGLIRYKFLFNLYANYSKAGEKITAGQYVLNMNFDYRALVQGMTARAGERVEITVPIPEGYTLSQIFARLVDYGVCQTEAELWEAAKNHDFKYSFLDKSTLGDEHRLEGFMFPETYNFYIDSTPVQAIVKFLNEFNKRFTEQYTERAEYMGYSVRDIITVASMIEREAGDDEERPRIAAVIYNRLNSGDFPHLQIDATIYYAIAGTGRPFSIDIESPYNTYICEGLPPGPIANPGIASIRAALYPESTNEYYYALNKTGTHEFFRTLSQQQAFIQSDDYAGR